MYHSRYTRRSFLRNVGMGLAGAAIPGCAGTSAGGHDAAQRPNLIVIFIDDLGYGDIEPFGSEENRTPCLNRMAAEGMKLTSFYVAAPVCSPSRAALMTGCYPTRVGLEKGSWFPVLLPGDEPGISADEILLPEMLKSVGYKTACIGKWHLGDQPRFLPTRHGFDYYYGIPYSNDMWPVYEEWNFPPLPLMRNDEVIGEVKDMDDQADLTRDFTYEAIRFIEDNRDCPYYLYLPHAMVHWPHAASRTFMDQARGDPHRAAVEEVDWSVGRIMQALRRLDLDRNTLVLFTSDNGADSRGSNLPLRGGKGSVWEGGMRVPTLAWWPGQVPAGAVCNEIATTMDILPTFARLAGTETPRDRMIDGKDMLDLLVGTPGAKSNHEAFYYKYHELDAVRSGDWKYFSDGWLFNLKKDIGEKENVAEQYPEIVAHMEQLLARGQEDLNDPARCRPAGKSDAPLKFLIPRTGISGEEAHSPVKRTPKK